MVIGVQKIVVASGAPVMQTLKMQVTASTAAMVVGVQANWCRLHKCAT